METRPVEEGDASKIVKTCSGHVSTVLICYQDSGTGRYHACVNTGANREEVCRPRYEAARECLKCTGKQGSALPCFEERPVDPTPGVCYLADNFSRMSWCTDRLLKVEAQARG